MTIRRRTDRRQGNILVLTAFMMIGMVALLAFAIDLGYVYVAKTECSDRPTPPPWPLPGT
jgi:Flp pilus assembly protein TadG